MNTRIKRVDRIEVLCNKVRQFGLEGLTQRMVCVELNMSMVEITQLRQDHPEFDSAWIAYRDFCQGTMERLMIKNVLNKGANSQLLGMIMRAEFPTAFEAASYRKESESKAAESESVDFQSEVDKLLRELNAIKD